MNFNEKGFCGTSRTGESIRFQLAISKFESSRPSHPFPRSARLPKRRENGPEIRAFCAFAFVSGLPASPTLRSNSPKVSGLVREYSRFAETIGGDGFDHDCRPGGLITFRSLVQIQPAQLIFHAIKASFYK
jgi:hypothetical protein